MLTVHGKRLDDPQHVFVIAEASGNHHQDYEVATALVHEAAVVGADAIKFQTFSPEDICADIPLVFGHDERHDVWLRRLGTTRMRELFAKGGLPRAWHKPLKVLAESLGLVFLSTPFSVDAAKFLVEDVGVGAIKIASGDLTFTPLLEYVAGVGVPVILSTGMATMAEVHQALLMLESGDVFAGIVLLHCISAYPCPEHAVNLRAVQTLAERTLYPCGFSDHTTSWDTVPMMAVACGACCIEKHIRLRDDTSSVDAPHSLAPMQFGLMVHNIRQATKMLGTGEKQPHALERHDLVWSRRSPEDWLRPTQPGREGRWE